MGQTDSKPNSAGAPVGHGHIGGSKSHDDLHGMMGGNPTSSSSTSLIYQNIPYTSYSYEKLPSKQEVMQQMNQQQPNNSAASSISNIAQLQQQLQQQELQSQQLQQQELQSQQQYNKDEIITLSKAENTNESEQELVRLEATPHFFPLLNDSDGSWVTPSGNPLAVSDMDNRGPLNVCIDVQNYLKNSTGYIVEKQHELIRRVKDVEAKQAKRITQIMSAKVSETTHAQYGFKEVTDKVKFNITKTKALVYRIGDLIEQLESALPEDDRENIKDQIYALLPRAPTYNPPKFIPESLLQSNSSANVGEAPPTSTSSTS